MHVAAGASRARRGRTACTGGHHLCALEQLGVSRVISTGRADAGTGTGSTRTTRTTRTGHRRCRHRSDGRGRCIGLVAEHRHAAGGLLVRDHLVAREEVAQVVAHPVRRGVTDLGLLCQALGHDGRELDRHPGRHLRQRHRVVVHLLVRGRQCRLGNERRPSRDHLVEHDAERVHVAARVGGLALGLLRREVRGGPHHGALLGEALVVTGVDRAGDAEVGHLRHAGVGDEDVRRLHVAVDHAVAVGEGERVGHLGTEARGHVGAQRAVAADDLGERVAGHELHGHEVGAAVLAPVVDPHDVRVVQAGRGLGLAAETLHEGGVGRVLGEQHLDGDLAVEQQVTGLPHLGHPAPPDAVGELVPVVDDGGVRAGHRTSAGYPRTGSGAVRVTPARPSSPCPARFSPPGRPACRRCPH